jgi:hypothetical protein
VKQSTAKFVPLPDPAGLDQLLLAAGEGIARWSERVLSAKIGRPVNFWDGQDGLGAILKEHIEAAGVPNKRLPDLITPRAVASGLGIVPQRRRRRRAHV